MYCIQCGVKLADTEEKCPLCGTVPYHPELKRQLQPPLYPKNRIPQPLGKSWIGLFVVTFFFVLPILITLPLNWQLSGKITWAGYVVGGLLTAYVLMVLPAWFTNPNPVIFVPCDFVMLGLFLLYVNHLTGGSWFLSFAFPVLGGVALIVTAVVTLLRYVRGGRLYIFGGALLAFGGLMLLVEFLMNVTFRFSGGLSWSLYPCVAMGLTGLLLTVVAICRPARDLLERKLFF